MRSLGPRDNTLVGKGKEGWLMATRRGEATHELEKKVSEGAEAGYW